VKYWEIIADNLSKAGWGCVAAIDSNGRTIWIADAHRGDGKRFVVRADEKLTAFVELEAAIQVGPTFFTAKGREFRLAICEGRLNRSCVRCARAMSTAASTFIAAA
jgi:hypothetical protein